uniref:Uncharacterized protein n=1 Tax=Desulfovibrio sp. U5L TaxID=596152 RepID=I2Q047_9BACT
MLDMHGGGSGHLMLVRANCADMVVETVGVGA